MRLYSLQALRFWAALAVVHLHAVERAVEANGDPGLLGQAASTFGRCGVDVFFVLSGLIITLTARGLTPGQFVAKRLRRIFPIYLLLAAPWIVMEAYAGRVSWRGMVSTLTLWPLTDRLSPPMMPVAWTLCFELLFYAAATVVIWHPRLTWGLLAAYAAALTLRSGPALQFLGNPIILEFLAGVGLAFLPRWKPAAWAIPAGLAVLVVGAALHWPPYGGAAEFLRGDQAWVRLLTLGVPAGLIVWGALQLDAKPDVFSYLGDASYVLYLVHPLALMLLAAALAWLPVKPQSDVIVLVGMAASVLFAWRVHELFEKPILAWLRRSRRLTPAKA